MNNQSCGKSLRTIVEQLLDMHVFARGDRLIGTFCSGFLMRTFLLVSCLFEVK